MKRAFGNNNEQVWFFSNLVGEEDSRIQGVKDPSICFYIFNQDPNQFLNYNASKWRK
jgi:hypothetical protein